MSAQDIDAGAALPKTPRDFLPLLLPVALALAALPFIPSGSTWVTLTIAGIAMGMMIFVMASGLTLIFGLMDVLNFGHGAFIAIGAYMATLVLIALAVFVAMLAILNRTKIGLLIRAGVENTEMVQALGYRITRLFVGVFMAGSALAGLGGVMWGLYREQVNAAMGSELLVLVFIVVIIGGLGSVTGCFIGALLVALATNYAGFLVPKLALVTDIMLMVVILLWRPRGLYPVTSR